MFRNHQIIDIVNLSQRVNMSVNSGRGQMAVEAMTSLYNAAMRSGGRSFLDLQESDCQCVGLAFTNIALYLNAGDVDINSVAAENAVYCLVRTFLTTGSSWTLPSVFTILYNRRNLLDDKLIASWCAQTQKIAGRPLGIVLGGNPYTDPRLRPFREQAVGFANDIMHYAVTQFYDIAAGSYKVPTDMFLHTPDTGTIRAFLASKSFSNDLAAEKKHLVSLYQECEKALKAF